MVFSFTGCRLPGMIHPRSAAEAMIRRCPAMTEFIAGTMWRMSDDEETTGEHDRNG
jgi:hypothetical protein